jgi:nicotinamidase/pyrazinamidase
MDFGPGGAIHTDKGLEVVRLANELMPGFALVAAVKDWHPANHVSFAANHLWRKPGQRIETESDSSLLLWPMHCVQDSFGADWLPGLDTDRIQQVFHKGTDPLGENFSGFFDKSDQQPSGLEAWLEEHQVKDVFILGFTTEYSVKNTALDALEFGYHPTVFLDACQPARLEIDEEEKALDQMEKAGVKLVYTADWLKK